MPEKSDPSRSLGFGFGGLSVVTAEGKLSSSTRVGERLLLTTATLLFELLLLSEEPMTGSGGHGKGGVVVALPELHHPEDFFFQRVLTAKGAKNPSPMCTSAVQVCPHSGHSIVAEVSTPPSISKA